MIFVGIPSQPLTGADCQTCGACCQGWDVELGAFDTRVPEKLVKHDDLLGALMRMRKGRCIALRGTIGEGCRCSIYELRPEVCRHFVSDSDDCRMARARVERDRNWSGSRGAAPGGRSARSSDGSA